MFKTTLYLLTVIPLLTGALNLALGLPGQRLIGARVSSAALSDPLLNSQIRFFAAIWFGFGLVLLLCISDTRKYSVLLKGSFCVIFLGGVGRAVSLLQFGLPATPVGALFVVATVGIELVGMPLLLWWHWRVDG